MVDHVKKNTSRRVNEPIDADTHEPDGTNHGSRFLKRSLSRVSIRPEYRKDKN